jgi:hypothetical protein
MKNIKKYLAILLFLKFSLTQAQLATTDPGQTAQNSTMIIQNAQVIATAMNQFKELKRVYEQGKQSYKEFVQIKDFIKASEDRLATIGDIKELRLNNVNLILDKVFCIKQGNYFSQSIRFLDIIRRIKAGFLNCSNKEIYDKTISGVLDHFDDRVHSAAKIGAKEIKHVMNEMNMSLLEADKTQTVLNGYNSRMKLELGLKYKAISDELMQLSEEVHLAINQEKGSDKNIALSPGERLKMMDMANQYQLQAMQYEEKSAQLLKEASEIDQWQQKKLLEIKRDLAYKQMINFSL